MRSNFSVMMNQTILFTILQVYFDINRLAIGCVVKYIYIYAGTMIVIRI